MNRELVETWFGAFRDKDLSKLEAGLADDFVHSSPFGQIRGKEAYLDLVRENAEAFFSPQIDIHDVIAGDGSFAVRYLVDGNPACDCIYVRDGQIAEIYAYYHVGKRPTLYEEW